jgi:hypothetical protein
LSERAVWVTLTLQPDEGLGWGEATIDGTAEGEADGAAGEALGLAGAVEGEADGAVVPQLMEATVMVACEEDSQM